MDVSRKGEGHRGKVGQDQWKRALRKGGGGWIDPVSVYFNAIKYRCVQLKQRRVTRWRITRLECRYRFRERRKSKRIDPIPVRGCRWRKREREERERKKSLFIPWNVVIFSISLIPSRCTKGAATIFQRKSARSFRSQGSKFKERENFPIEQEGGTD